MWRIIQALEPAILHRSPCSAPIQSVRQWPPTPPAPPGRRCPRNPIPVAGAASGRCACGTWRVTRARQCASSAWPRMRRSRAWPSAPRARCCSSATRGENTWVLNTALSQHGQWSAWWGLLRACAHAAYCWTACMGTAVGAARPGCSPARAIQSAPCLRKFDSAPGSRSHSTSSSLALPVLPPRARRIAAHDVKGRARAARRGCVTCFKLSPNLRKAAAAAGEPGAGAADVARLDAVMEVAIKSDVAPDLAAEPAMAGQQPRGC